MLFLVFQIPSLNQGFWYKGSEECFGENSKYSDSKYLDSKYSIGDLVLVPFRNSTKYGIILDVASQEDERYNKILQSLNGATLKQIDKIIYKNIISASFISFLKSASEYNCIDFVKILDISFPSHFVKFISTVLLKNKQEDKEYKYKNIYIDNIDNTDNIKLNHHQNDIYFAILNKINDFSVNVINGITGSGKTSIFLKIAQKVIAQNKKVLILVPEIALSKHISTSIEKFTEKKPFIWNSDVKHKDKKAYLNNILSEDGNIFLGTRSSLFLPYKNLGLIIIDEEHDSSYKQNESPVYHARDMAVLRAMKENIPIILSSATPSLETKININNKKYNEYLLNNRFYETELPKINIEKTNFSKDNIINENILKQIYDNFKNNKQTLIFLNRRGYSRSIFCKDCKDNPKCENCDNILSYHSKKKILKCHYCNFCINFNNCCPKCDSKKIKDYGGYGIEKINQFMEEFFIKMNEKVNIQTISSDNLKDSIKDNNIQEILNNINNNKIHIIIGTEIISKGYHFSNLSLVVILDFNCLSNEEGDIRMNERIFQLVMQVSGRAGREKENGNILIQIDKESKVFEFIKNYQQEEFYNFEIMNRKKFNLPPFVKFIAVIISSNFKDKAIKISKQFDILLQKEIDNLIARKNISNFEDKIKILGPSESFLSFLKRSYRYRFLIKIKDLTLLKDIKKILQKSSNLDKNIKIDVDPFFFL